MNYYFSESTESVKIPEKFANFFSDIVEKSVLLFQTW